MAQLLAMFGIFEYFYSLGVEKIKHRGSFLKHKLSTNALACIFRVFFISPTLTLTQIVLQLVKVTVRYVL